MFTMIGNILRNFFGKPATRLYPFERRKSFEGSRGHLKIDIKQCIFCGLCARSCPANALSVQRTEKTWTLDPYRCIICGYCVEKCPKKCLFMDPLPGDYSKQNEE